MKRFLLLCTVLLANINCILSQDIPANSVPTVVIKAFQHKYSNATNAKWELKNQNYEVVFKLDLKKHTTEFNNTGIWLETRITLKLTDVTTAIKNDVKRSFSKYKIMQITKVETKDKATFYEIIFNKDATDITILFAPDGKILDRKVELMNSF